MHFATFLVLVTRLQKSICASNRAAWELDPYGLSPTLCDSNMSEHKP